MEALERHYRFFIDETNHYGFFLGLSEYLKYVKDIPFLMAAMQEALKDRDAEYALLDELENRTTREQKSTKKN